MAKKTKKTPMKLVLVQPPSYDWMTPSCGLALISAHLKAAGIERTVVDSSMRVRKALGARLKRGFKDHVEYHKALTDNPKIVDRLLEREVGEVLSLKPTIVAFAVLTYTEKWALAMAKEIKRRSPATKVVFGGAQCLRENGAFDYIALPEVDFVMLGEADVSFVKLVRALERRPDGRIPSIRGVLMKRDGKIVDGGDEEGVKDMDSLPFLDFSGFPMKDYVGDVIYLNLTRSCIRRCRFCTHFMMQKVYSDMSPKRSLAEIKHQLETFPGRKMIVFSDSLLNGDVKRLSELADLLLDYRLQRLGRGGKDMDFGWSGMAILHKTTSAPLLKKLYASGCRELAYGLESGSQKVIDLMDKKFKVSEAEKVIRDSAAAGIRAKIYAQCGFPGETEEDVDMTVDFVRRNKAHLSNVSVSFTEIYKGSELDLHPERYGIKTPITDRTRWETVDGTNTYEIREARCRRVADAARECGIDVVDVYASKLGI